MSKLNTNDPVFSNVLSIEQVFGGGGVKIIRRLRKILGFKTYVDKISLWSILGASGKVILGGFEGCNVKCHIYYSESILPFLSLRTCFKIIRNKVIAMSRWL